MREYRAMRAAVGSETPPGAMLGSETRASAPFSEGNDEDDAGVGAGEEGEERSKEGREELAE